MTGTIVTASRYVGRFAPSPTGPLHLGSLFAALVSYLDARHARGQWLLRIEDIDPPREVEGATDAIIATLEKHGLLWDEPIVYQSRSTARILDAVAHLQSNGAAYFCECARRQLRARNQLDPYPGICRDKTLGEGALRARIANEVIQFTDRWQRIQAANLKTSPGDFVIRRRDGLFAYQLAVCVDDAYQGVTDVVRGVDLLSSTPRQIYLQRLLNLPTPRYAHFPVLNGSDGQKLSKQTGAPPIDDTRASQNLEHCLSLMGMSLPAEMSGADPAEILQWACLAYDPKRLSQKPIAISIDE
ncbi:MAG: tRNA glutamyl-Q(34) synthetase GluQRS [Pseudomonadota bacterium]